MHSHGSRRSIDGRHPRVDPNVEIESRREAFGSLQQQAFPLSDDTADEIGQTAVRERDIRTGLVNRDVGGLVQATKSRGGRHSPGDATHNDDFHG